MFGSCYSRAIRGPAAPPAGPLQEDVDALRGLLDLMAGFSGNDQRARYLLSSNWLRDRGAAAATHIGGLSAIEGTLKTEAAPAGRQGPAGA